MTSWHYKRSYHYGSPQLKADGTPGIDRLVPSSAYLSKDGRTVFVGLPDIKPVMQMRVGWSIATADGATIQDSVSFTPYELTTFDPIAEGFGSLTVNLAPRTIASAAAGPVSAEEGRLVYQRYGCVACHASEPSGVAKLGPNSRRAFTEWIARSTTASSASPPTTPTCASRSWSRRRRWCPDSSGSGWACRASRAS